MLFQGALSIVAGGNDSVGNEVGLIVDHEREPGGVVKDEMAIVEPDETSSRSVARSRRVDKRRELALASGDEGRAKEQGKGGSCRPATKLKNESR